MINLINIVILILEVVFYSCFMYFSKREGKLYVYTSLFTLVTIMGVFVGTDNLISYLILILSMLLGLKYMVRVKTTLYDMFVIVCMLLFKILLEMVLSYPLLAIIGHVRVAMLAMGVVKTVIVALSNKPLHAMYEKMQLIWYRNNFYIRYIFGMLVFLYTIVSCSFLIIN